MDKKNNKLIRPRFQKKEYLALGFTSEKEAKKQMRKYMYAKWRFSALQMLVIIILVILLFFYYKPWEIIREIIRII